MSMRDLAAARTCGVHPEYPALDPCNSLLRSAERRLEERCECAIVVRTCEPGRNAVGIVLVLCSILALKAASPERRVDFGNNRASRRYVPAVEGPEVNSPPESLADQALPGKSRMRRLRDRTLHVKVKDRFRPPSALLGEAPPAAVSRACRAVAGKAIADEIHVDVVAVGRPVALKVLEKRRPVMRQLVDLEIAQWEGEGMIDADQGRNVLSQSVDEPFRDAAPGPVLSW